jgi:hypothetical protein
MMKRRSDHANWYVLHPSFFLKNNKTSVSRMRLFGYIRVFADDVRDNEGTIWHHACWGRGGAHHEAHACWGRGLAVVAHHHCGPTGGRRGPSPTGPHYRGPTGGRSPTEGRGPTGPSCHGPTRGRGGPSPPLAILSEGRGCLVLVPPLVSSSPFFFFSKTQEILLTLFCHKRGRFVG